MSACTSPGAMHACCIFDDSCFAALQGVICIDSFQAMQACLQKHPEAFADFLENKDEIEAVIGDSQEQRQ